MTKPRKKPYKPPPMPPKGDHGPDTEAATKDTRLELVEGDKNNMHRRRRMDRIEEMVKRGQLTMRQYQAAKAIRDAWCLLGTLEGGPPPRERVQSTLNPAAVAVAQMQKQSKWTKAMWKVTKQGRGIVEHVCCYNEPFRKLQNPKAAKERFEWEMDRVADYLGI